MEETHFYQRPWFYIVSRAVTMLALYAGVLNYQRNAGNFNIVSVIGDAILFGFLLLIWLAFFAQFVLPVQTFEERRQIFDLLRGHLGGSRGPAIFIKNGQVIERAGESDLKGHGVLWLDSASGVVTHVNVSLKNTFGPGVHFTEHGEKIAGAVDLHNQTQSIGPREKERSFGPQGEISAEEFLEIQNRRTMVSALTRDGIEVVPNISVTFKIDADPLSGDQPGSHFGYNKEAVSNAIIKRAVNSSPKAGSTNEVAWNELPAYIAADLWREYMSKFRLQQLFSAESVLPPSFPVEKKELDQKDTEALYNPIQIKTAGRLEETVVGMLHELNNILAKLAERCEDAKPVPAPVPPPPARAGSKPSDVGNKTALQLINFMVKERMTNPKAAILDENGRWVPGHRPSDEYSLLKQRGIRILSVNIGNLRFANAVEEQLVRQWTANWLVNARNERERIETLRSFAAINGQEQAIVKYAEELSEHLDKHRTETSSLKEAIKFLIARTRMILVRNDRMHRRATNEFQTLEEILQWLETNQA